jgi:hypothetical protein
MFVVSKKKTIPYGMDLKISKKTLACLGIFILSSPGCTAPRSLYFFTSLAGMLLGELRTDAEFPLIVRAANH